MRQSSTLGLAAWFILVLLSAQPCSRLEAQSTGDSSAVAQTVNAFHGFLASGDSLSALDLLSPDVVIVESGSIEDLAHYRAGHLPADMRYEQAVVRTPGAIRVVIVGDVAWATSTATAVGEVGDRAVNSTSAELMVLSRTGDRWRIRAIHWSSRRAR